MSAAELVRVDVHFRRADGVCTLYRREVAPADNPALADALDVVLNGDAHGGKLPIDLRPRGRSCQGPHE